MGTATGAAECLGSSRTQRSELALCTPHMHVHMPTHMHTHMPCTCTQVKPGKGPAFVRTTLKNLETGAS